MEQPEFGEVIELRSVDPAGDLACNTAIATPEARAGLGAELARHLLRPVRELPDGIEVRFAPEGWPAVQRYVELESRCCSFLTLRVERAKDDIVLTVTGRPEAKAWISQIFS
ncbi:MAG: hypothetical protein HY873_03025 [Chloroflexi bacterium]|nr:hypothetical protein [Chloroflexota bacterium]